MESFSGELAISTCWASKGVSSGAELLDRIESTGLNRLELEYRITSPIMQELLPLIKERGFTVSSLHNFCPLPPRMPPQMASGDLFNFASPDKEERLLAVRHTARTMELASDLEARAVVLHLGYAPMEKDRDVTENAAQKGELTPAAAALLEQRAQHSALCVDMASFTLERLIPRAESLGLILGLENRIRIHQVPTLDELEQILKRFEGSPMAPWFDLGHATVQANAGLGPASGWLERLGPDFIGCHLHDIKNETDHLAPGEGDVDWPRIMKALKDVPLKVLEIAAGAEAEKVREGSELLEGLISSRGSQDL